jgi:DMSO/TMAO reductase YedYZ heme-binding membrane subunit
MATHKTLANLHYNARFYIVLATISLSILIAGLLRILVPSDQLFAIRLQQVFGYLCLVYWYAALIISPLGNVYKNQPVMALLQFSRRGLGVSAAYFALLHVTIALWGQLGGIDGALLLPSWFVWSFAFGLVGLVSLTLMAATSFDKVISFMTFRRWKWLHRFGYIGGVLVLAHVWMIGTHMAYLSFRSIIFVMLAVLLLLESLRICGLLAKKYQAFRNDRVELAVALWLVLTVALFITPNLIGNYQDKHAPQHAMRTEGRA